MTTQRSVSAIILGAALAAATLAASAQQAAPPKDRSAVEAAFVRADANADGKVSKDEAGKVPAIAARFDELDRNKDGALSLDEFGAGYSAAP